MRASSCGTLLRSTASLSLGKVSQFGEPPESSASYNLAVVASRPVSIFLRVLTGFFLLGQCLGSTRSIAQIDRLVYCVQVGD